MEKSPQIWRFLAGKVIEVNGELDGILQFATFESLMTPEGTLT
jgi:hypothetical protein